MESQAWRLIEKAIQVDDWTGARRLINAQLRRSPKDHWLRSRLALTYYEQRQYEKALYWEAMALEEAPYCPLAIWGYASALNMLDRDREALVLYRWLLSWGKKRLPMVSAAKVFDGRGVSSLIVTTESLAFGKTSGSGRRHGRSMRTT
jgi:tetratricopeptide (TPR) repeat protein